MLENKLLYYPGG